MKTNPTTTDAAIEVLAQIVAAIHPRAGHTVEARGNMFGEGCAALSVLRNTETPATAHGGDGFIRACGDLDREHRSPPAGGFVVDEMLSVARDLDELAKDGWLCASVAAEFIRSHVPMVTTEAEISERIHNSDQFTTASLRETFSGLKPRLPFVGGLGTPTAQPSDKDGVRGVNDDVSGLDLAVIGVRHFGNPIPQQWYSAARELLSTITSATTASGLVDGDEFESAIDSLAMSLDMQQGARISLHRTRAKQILATLEAAIGREVGNG